MTVGGCKVDEVCGACLNMSSCQHFAKSQPDMSVELDRLSLGVAKFLSMRSSNIARKCVDRYGEILFKRIDESGLSLGAIMDRACTLLFSRHWLRSKIVQPCGKDKKPWV